MTMFQPISVASDRVMAALIAGLEIEFGRGVGEALARRKMRNFVGKRGTRSAGSAPILALTTMILSSIGWRSWAI